MKKQQELEEERRRQEELIKEQLKAMHMSDEILQLEEEKERQEKLVQETIQKQVEDDSSWETDSDQLESESEEEFSEAEGKIKSVYMEGLVSLKSNEGSKSLATDEASKIRSLDSALSRSSRRARPRPRRGRRPLKRSIHGRRSPLPRHVTLGGDQDHVPDLEEVSVFSANSELSGGSLLKHGVLEKVATKKLNRHGDEISVGTLDMESRSQDEEVSGEEDSNVRFSREVNVHGADIDAGILKKEQPWNAFAPKRNAGPALASISEGGIAGSPNKGFFEEHQHVFDRSVFNFAPFNNSMNSSKLNFDDDTTQQDEADTVTSHPEEKNESEDGNGEDEDEKSLDNGVQDMLDFLASTNFESSPYDFDGSVQGIENSKLAEKLKDNEAKFEEQWENIETDQNIAEQIKRRLQERKRNRSSGKVKEKKEEGFEEIPRLYLFEGEKVDPKKKKRNKKKSKERKRQKKLETTLSKEFRKAMREMFESESEEEYDKNFGGYTDENEEQKSSQRMAQRGSNAGSIFDDGSVNSGSQSKHHSETSDEFDDDYLKKLQKRSMQQEVRDMLYDRNVVSDDDASENSEMSRPGRNHRLVERSDSNSELGSRGSGHGRHRGRARRKKVRRRRNKSGEVVGSDIDPAEVYARELEKQKGAKILSVAELRKEMEDLTKGFNAFDAVTNSTKVLKPKPPQTKKAKSNANLYDFEPLPVPEMVKDDVSKKKGFNLAVLRASVKALAKLKGKNTPSANGTVSKGDEAAFLTGGGTSGGFGGVGGGGVPAPGGFQGNSPRSEASKNLLVNKAIAKFKAPLKSNASANGPIGEGDKAAFPTGSVASQGLGGVGGGSSSGAGDFHGDSSQSEASNSKTNLFSARFSGLSSGFAGGSTSSSIMGGPSRFQEPLPVPATIDEEPSKKKNFNFGALKAVAKFKGLHKKKQKDDEGGMGLLG